MSVSEKFADIFFTNS